MFLTDNNQLYKIIFTYIKLKENCYKPKLQFSFRFDVCSKGLHESYLGTYYGLGTNAQAAH